MDLFGGIEETKEEKLTQVQVRFDLFWKAYPKKRNKGHAEKVFKRLKPDETLLAMMLKAISLSCKRDQWQKNRGEFIPYPATWIAARGWEDEDLKITAYTLTPAPRANVMDYAEPTPEQRSLNAQKAREMIAKLERR